MRATKLGCIAFITTPTYRQESAAKIADFVYGHLYSLSHWFTVLTTGRTYVRVMELVDGPITPEHWPAIALDTGWPVNGESDLVHWRQAIHDGVVRQGDAIEGMIEITYELVGQRLDAIIHLTDWADIMGKPDSMVLRREANVHEVPIANDIDTAAAFVTSWKSSAIRTGGVGPVFRARTPPKVSPLDGIEPGQSVLALIAHDQMKLPMCQLVVEQADRLFDRYEYILATGTTGDWVKRFLQAARRSKQEVDRVRCCLSGPYGGDVQIAAAVIRRLCHTVVFFQDPHTSHPHAGDVMLFEQAVLLFQRLAVSVGREVKLVTNLEGARVLLSMEGTSPAVTAGGVTIQ